MINRRKHRRNRKQICLAVLAVCAVLLSAAVFVTGCGSGSGSGQDVSTRTVTDMEGREVTIPADPQRVACIYSSAAHMMAMLEEQDRIIAVPNGVKSDELMKMKIDGLDSLSVPMQDNDLNVEELMSIRADLIIVKRDQIIAKGQEEKLEKAGIPWIVADYESIDELNRCITLMGEIFNDQDRASAYNQFAADTIEDVQQRLRGTAGDPQADGKDRPKIYHSVNEAIRTDEAGGICQEIMEKAGVSDISADKELSVDGNKAYATIEEIYNWDPDGMIANESSVTEYILSDSKWAGLSAVKEGRVYTLPVGASRWCHPGSMEAHMGVLAVAWRFYPEAFEDLDLAQFTKEYYREYFGLDLEDEVIDNILAGQGMRKSNDAQRK